MILQCRSCILYHIMDFLWYTRIVAFLFILQFFSFHAQAVKRSIPKTLLISVAGFQNDYLSKLDCPNLQHFVAHGTSVRNVLNSINVASITNHYSIVTGLYPESHGIVSNTMVDPELHLVFNSKTRDKSEWWTNVHPIWQEIEKQGKGVSGLCHWPGVYGPMKSKLHCKPHENNSSLKVDIDQAKQWFESDVKLVLLYSDRIQKAAVKWGPFSQQAIDEVKKFDLDLQYLIDETRQLEINILLTSESGVTDLQWNHVVDLDQCLIPKSYIIIQPQATLLMYPKHGYTAKEIHENLTKCRHIKSFLKENLPEYFHFTHNPRIPPIIAFVPLGAVVRSSKAAYKKTNEILNGSLGLPKDLGASGYHPGYDVMKGVFFAKGPSFRRGLKFRAINNTDIYAILCTILDVTPRPNNASFHLVKSMLKDTNFEDNPVPTKRHPVATNRHAKRKKKVSKYHGLLGDLEWRGFVIFLACSAGLMFLCLCIACADSMRRNANGEFQRKTSVRVPLLRADLSDFSSTDE